MQRNVRGRTPIHIAVRKEQKDMIKLLVAYITSESNRIESGEKESRLDQVWR